MFDFQKLTGIVLGCCFLLFSMGAGGKEKARLQKNYAFKHYTLHDGLAQMQVMSLFHDSKGYLWCVTKAGLSRFDGRTFTNYQGAVNMPGFDITTMAEADDGRLILFGSSQFAVIENDSIRYQNFPENVYCSSNYSQSNSQKLKQVLHHTTKGTLQCALLNYANPDSMHIIPTNADLSTLIHVDENGLIWQMKADSLYVSDIEKGKLQRTIYNPHGIHEIVNLGDSIIGINHKHEFFSLEKDGFKFRFKVETNDRFIKTIATPQNDALIIKTDRNLYYYRDELVVLKENLTQIRDILFDYEDNLWVATEEGLYNFFQLNFVNYTFNKGNKDWVWSVIEDADGAIWFASYQNGLWKLKDDRVVDYTDRLNQSIHKHLKRPHVPAQYRYYMGASRAGETLYFPTECNVLEYKNDRFSPVEGIAELPYQITKSYNDGTILLGGYPGLFRKKKEEETRFWHRDSIGISSILSVEKLEDDRILAVGKYGVAVINETDIQKYNAEPFLHSYSTTTDHKNNVWIGGIGHVNLFDWNGLKTVEKMQEEAFYSLLFYPPHFLFLGGLKGLYLVDLAHYYSSGEFEMNLYNQSNGFTGIECGQNGFFTDSSGKVWIPTSDLVVQFDPKKLIGKAPLPPKIYVHPSFSTDNIHWHKTTFRNNQQFKYNENSVRFGIEAVSLAGSGKIRYYYQLEGLQNQWSDPSEVNEVTFYNLKPGIYTLNVKADVGISSAQSEVRSYSFSVARPFWTEWYFYTFLSLFGLVVLYFLIRYFSRRERRKAAIQQRIIQLRSEALSSQLDPHFVMNCLNNISGLINGGYRRQANDYIVKFSKLLRVILQSVKRESISLREELDMARKYMELEQYRCGQCFDFKVTLPQNYSPEKILVPPMLIQPLVENSIKHGFDKETKNARIEIKIEVLDNKLSFSICDNGKGMQTNSQTKGTGLGTQITRERIELLQKKSNIKFNIRNQDKGVKITFDIPLVLQHS